ncbi:MAG TPA: biotin--[acetyl-CoA-carboxylase] ligase [Thermoleophilia bacterium]|nr:biotin--[acetyl-CoA-carboxylase] ligase [Thermoleophilia bacterium]
MDPSVSVTYIESAAMSQRKKTVIDILRDSQDFVSGEAISDVLGISRNAVHKHVKSLRKRGYRIVGVSRRGYRLEDEPARLSMGHVTQRTEHSMFGHSFRYHDEIESTNLEAKSLALKGAPEGTVVVAEAQSAGRGRLGRRWTSPAGKGLLFSVILRPQLPMSEAHMLTIVAATAAAEAIEKHVSARVAIKWPNDLFIGDRKVGGILTEVSGEQDDVDWIVLGTGLNVNTEFSELPVPLRRTATSLKIAGGEVLDRSDILATMLLGLETSYKSALRGGFDKALTAFRDRDFLLSRTVSVETRQGPVIGAAAGIDDRGALLVELPHRRIRSFHSGDVTLHS